MEKRYQVFVSSTFQDLEDARKEISSALLKSDCFPAGMELFPAADLEQFEYIKQVISESDYYLIVSAGKYGSIHSETDLSFTEMEYDFAVEIGKPIIRLLHKNPFDALPGSAIEKTDDGRKKLEALREKLTKSRLVNFWSDFKELGQQTILALIDAKKRNPTQGWVRGENAITMDLMRELEVLRSLATKQENRQTDTLVSFDDLVKHTQVPILIDSKDEKVPNKKQGEATIVNKDVAEAIFRSLISNRNTKSIGQAASDILTTQFNFPVEYEQFDHYWLELNLGTVEYFLHYLESRGLVRGTASEVISDWQLTPRGRQHATYLSSLRNLGWEIAWSSQAHKPDTQNDTQTHIAQRTSYKFAP